MSLEEKLRVLEGYARIYGKHRLYETKTSLETIMELMSNSAKQNLLVREFENLTTNSKKEFLTIEERFSPKDYYVKRCFDYLDNIITKLLQTNKDNLIQNFTESLTNLHNVPNMVKNWAYPMEISTRTPPESMKDVYIVFNSEYHNKIEGIYKNDLRICFIWNEFSNNNIVNATEIMRWKINELKQKFESNKYGTIPFEGYNNHIRNAIAHVTFSYNPDTETIEYSDEQADWKQSFDSFELMKLSEKLMNFNFLMTFFFGILFTYDIAFCPTRVISKEMVDFHTPKKPKQ